MDARKVRGRLTILIFLAPVAQGCFAYTIQIALDHLGKQEATCNDTAAVQVVVAEVARDFQFTQDPSITLLRSLSRDSASEYTVLDSYNKQSDSETHYAGIRLSVVTDKRSGQLSIVIRDLRHGSQTDFTRRLEETITTSLTARVPSCEMKIEREWEGPILFAP